MQYEDYIKMGLDGEAPLKVILCGMVEENPRGKVGVVSVVYVTMDRVQAEAKLRELLQQNQEERYYMVYSVPLDTDLTALSHYPSIEITKEDLE